LHSLHKFLQRDAHTDEMKIAVIDGRMLPQHSYRVNASSQQGRNQGPMRRTKVACFQAKVTVCSFLAKQKLILVSVHMVMDELCCPRWLWRALPDCSNTEKLADPFQKYGTHN